MRIKSGIMRGDFWVDSRETEGARLGDWDNPRSVSPRGVLMRVVLDARVGFEMSGVMYRPERYLRALVRHRLPAPSKFAVPRFRLLTAYLSVQVHCRRNAHHNRWFESKL
jgi:hypothetical protein